MGMIMSEPDHLNPDYATQEFLSMFLTLAHWYKIILASCPSSFANFLSNDKKPGSCSPPSTY